MDETWRQRVTHAYIGTKPCGCRIAFCIDDPQFVNDTAEAVAEFIQSGLTITRVPISECIIKRCTHEDAKA